MGRHEGRHLDGRQTRISETFDQLDLDGGRNDLLLVLQPVARAYFDDFYLPGQAHDGFNSTQPARSQAA